MPCSCYLSKQLSIMHILVILFPSVQQIAHILTSLSRVFDTDSVLLTLCGEQRVWIRNAIGFAAGDFAWRWAFCGWSLAPPSPQVLVIEDTLKDARCLAIPDSNHVTL